MYVLNLVSCAIARGATWIQIEVFNCEYRMGFDGRPFSRGELHDLFHSQDPGCADLAVALLGSRPINPEWLVFQTWDGRLGHLVQIYEDQLYIQETKRIPWSSTELVNCFRLHETPVFYRSYGVPLEPYFATIKNWVDRLKGVERAETAFLRARCKFGPAPLWINGERVPVPVSPYADVDLIGEGDSPPVMKHNPAQYQVDCALWGRIQVSGEDTSSWQWIVAGVAFVDRNPGRLPPGLAIQVYANHLAKDFSQGQLVENDDLAQAGSAVESVLATAIKLVCDNYQRKPREADVLKELRRWSEKTDQLGNFGRPTKLAAYESKAAPGPPAPIDSETDQALAALPGLEPA